MQLEPRHVSLAQAALFTGGGVWPVVHIRSFEKVFGPKIDRWLVKTVGLLLTSIGGVLALAGGRRRVGPEHALLGAATAASLAAIDLWYAPKGRIAKIYLLDALVELGVVAGWALAWRGR